MQLWKHTWQQSMQTGWHKTSSSHVSTCSHPFPLLCHSTLTYPLGSYVRLSFTALPLTQPKSCCRLLVNHRAQSGKIPGKSEMCASEETSQVNAQLDYRQSRGQDWVSDKRPAHDNRFGVSCSVSERLCVIDFIWQYQLHMKNRNVEYSSFCIYAMSLKQSNWKSNENICTMAIFNLLSFIRYSITI